VVNASCTCEGMFQVLRRVVDEVIDGVMDQSECCFLECFQGLSRPSNTPARLIKIQPGVRDHLRGLLTIHDKYESLR
jgi:hypothetical protein